MSTEERLELLLRRETERYQPEAGGFERIGAKLRRRRRRRVAARSSLGVVAVGVIAALVVTLTGPGGGRQDVAVGPASPQPGGRGGPALVAVSRTSVEFVSPATGAVLRTVPLASRLPSAPVGQIAASPSGREVYAAVYNSNLDTSCPRQLVAIDTATGAQRIIATGASAPAVNPAGTELAYLTSNGPLEGTGLGPVCLPTTVTVQNLRTGTRRSWRISPPPVKGQGTEILESLAWAPQGADLVIGSGAGPSSGIQILDTAKPAGAGNPLTVGPWATPTGLPPGRYASPVEQRNGTIVALAPGCWGFMKCVAPVSVKTVDPATAAGHTVATFTNRAPTGIVADPTGNRLIAEIPTGTKMQLVSVAEHHTSLLATVPGPVAWAAHAITSSSGRSPGNGTARRHPDRALPGCQADQLSLTMPFRDPSAEWFLSGPPGGNRVVLSLRLTNTSASPCALGRSTVALWGPHPGSVLRASSAQFASGLPTSADISVKPGDYAQLLLATWFSSTCSSRAVSIRISFPGWSTPITRTLPPPDSNSGYRGFFICSGSLSVSWPLRSSDTNPFGQLRPPAQASGASGPSDPTGVSGSPGLSTTTAG